MAIKIYHDIIQGSEAWYALRCGVLTASEMDCIITPAQLKRANNKDSRNHLMELAGQRITKYVEPCYIGDHMMRGMADEIEARQLYHKHFAPVTEVGFVTNDKWGFMLGCSPDGLVDEDGAIESKSRLQKYQVATIIDDAMPSDFLIQVQTILLVTERKWCDFISFCAGMPMFPKRVHADEAVQNAIVEISGQFHDDLSKLLALYEERLAAPGARFIPTERKIEQEISV